MVHRSCERLKCDEKIATGHKRHVPVRAPNALFFLPNNLFFDIGFCSLSLVDVAHPISVNTSMFPLDNFSILVLSHTFLLHLARTKHCLGMVFGLLGGVVQVDTFPPRGTATKSIRPMY